MSGHLHNALYIGDVEERIKVLKQVGQGRGHYPSCQARSRGVQSCARWPDVALDQISSGPQPLS